MDRVVLIRLTSEMMVFMICTMVLSEIRLIGFYFVCYVAIVSFFYLQTVINVSCVYAIF